MRPHLLDFASTISDIIPKDHLQYVSSLREEDNSFLYSLSCKLSHVCYSLLCFYDFLLKLLVSDFFGLFDAVFETRGDIMTTDVHFWDTLAKATFIHKEFESLKNDHMKLEA